MSTGEMVKLEGQRYAETVIAKWSRSHPALPKEENVTQPERKTSRKQPVRKVTNVSSFSRY